VELGEESGTAFSPQFLHRSLPRKAWLSQGAEPPNLDKNRNDISMLIEFCLRNVRSIQVTPKLNICAATITALHSHSTKAGVCVSPTVACDSGDHRLTRVLAWTTVNQTLNPIHNAHQRPISHFISSNVKLIYCTTTQNEQRNRRPPAHQSRETVCAFQLVARNITAVILRTETHSSIGRHIDHVFSLECFERKTYSISCAKTLALRSLRNERG